MSTRKEITRDDILPFDDYASTRKERKQALMAVKKDRRMEVGPHATFYFENYETMWNQVHEMLYIERGGDEQIPDELAAYNPLIPQGRELIATVMFEIGDPDRRAKVLSTLGGVEETISITVGGDTIMGVAETDVDRTTADGKASSVQFVHFPFTDDQVAAFRAPDAEVTVGFGHESYAHRAGMPASVRAALAQDFD
tara:strand:- start:15360 stop:15950 length:591 start_codon:yes stop_codon:yes gene_type:complete